MMSLNLNQSPNIFIQNELTSCSKSNKITNHFRMLDINPVLNLDIKPLLITHTPLKAVLLTCS